MNHFIEATGQTCNLGFLKIKVTAKYSQPQVCPFSGSFKKHIDVFNEHIVLKKTKQNQT